MDEKMKPLILDYSDEGLSLDEIEPFIESIRAFKKIADKQYKGQNVKLYLLPKEMIDMMFANSAQVGDGQ